MATEPDTEQLRDREGQPRGSQRRSSMERPLAGWERQIRDAVDAIASQLDRAEAQPGATRTQELEEARGFLRKAEQALGRPWLDRVFNRWSGALTEHAWNSLHEARALVTLIEPAEDVEAKLPGLAASVTANLPAGDDRVRRYTRRLRKIEKQAMNERTANNRSADAFIDRHRPEISRIKRESDAASDQAHVNLRAFRNLLWVATASGAAVCLLVLFASLIDSELFDLSDPGVREIGLAGIVGGAVGALLSVRSTEAAGSLFELSHVQFLLRLPTGALSAVLGVVLLNSGVIADIDATGESLLAYAIVFGVAPELGLRLVDRRAEVLTADARTKNDPRRGEKSGQGGG